MESNLIDFQKKCLTWRSKGRAASWRFCSFVFYQALGLRLASESGTPLSFTLGIKNMEGTQS